MMWGWGEKKEEEEKEKEKEKEEKEAKEKKKPTKKLLAFSIALPTHASYEVRQPMIADV